LRFPETWFLAIRRHTFYLRHGASELKNQVSSFNCVEAFVEREARLRNPIIMKPTPFVQKVADKIIDLRLTMPAVLLLEAHKPLAFLGSQLLLVAQPTFDIFFPKNFIGNLAELLAEPHQLEQLIRRLETENHSPEVLTSPGVKGHD
jgi:hypothetical protein